MFSILFLKSSDRRTDERKETLLWFGLPMDGLHQNGMRWGAVKIHEKTKTSVVFQCFPARMQQPIGFAEGNADYPHKDKLACDPSQNMGRFAVGEVASDCVVMPCIIPDGWPWIGHANRCVPAVEKLHFKDFQFEHRKISS